MAVCPLIALVNKGKSVIFCAIIEALVLVPLTAVISGFLLAQTGLSQEISLIIGVSVNGIASALIFIYCSITSESPKPSGRQAI